MTNSKTFGAKVLIVTFSFIGSVGYITDSFSLYIVGAYFFTAFVGAISLIYHKYK